LIDPIVVQLAERSRAMRHGIAAVLALLVLLAGSSVGAQSTDRRTGGGAALAALGSSFSGRVVSVADGDTLDVMTKDNRRVRIRLEGIDSPERGEPFSNVARNFTRGLAFDKTVQVKVHDVDRYGRLVARVTSGGKDVSVELVTAGLARHYTVFSFDKKLEAAQREAQQARRGMWVNGVPSRSTTRESAAASNTRQVLSPPNADGPFVANVRSRVYHANTCRNAGCKNCTRQFRTQADAKAAGFRPAGDCLKSREELHEIEDV
jgi:endonuclease YncB( thermonuclease family)